MFITSLLFGSSRLRFSEPQTTAALEWATALGGVNVPSLGELSRCMEDIKARVGDPTTEMETTLGAVFHVNDVGHAIAKV